MPHSAESSSRAWSTAPGAKGGADFEHGQQIGQGRTGNEDDVVESVAGGVPAGVASSALHRFVGHDGMSPLECLDLADLEGVLLSSFYYSTNVRV